MGEAPAEDIVDPPTPQTFSPLHARREKRLENCPKLYRPVDKPAPAEHSKPTKERQETEQARKGTTGKAKQNTTGNPKKQCVRWEGRTHPHPHTATEFPLLGKVCPHRCTIEWSLVASGPETITIAGVRS